MNDEVMVHSGGISFRVEGGTTGQKKRAAVDLVVEALLHADFPPNINYFL